MKILVISDTHGNLNNIEKVLNKYEEIKTIFHLGDGKADIDLIKDKFKDRVFFSVCGNCDSGTTLPVALTKIFENKTFFLTHGHKFNVKENLDELITEALKQKADIALFGHTHVPLKKQVQNITIFNPGSLEKDKGSFGIITVGNNKLLTEIFGT